MGDTIEEKILETAQEQQLTDDANRRAAATPLPGALADAFLRGAIQVDETTFVRRVVASDWPILQWLNSPLYRLILEIQKDEAIREEIPYTDEEEWEMCWQFTHSPKECRALKEKGREVFKQTAIDEIGDSSLMGVQKKIVSAISAQVVASFGTKVGFGDGEEVKKKNLNQMG